MNRYLANGILIDLLDDKRILFLGETRAGIWDAMHCLLDAAINAGLDPSTDLTVRRVHGHESVGYRAGHGRVDFSSVNSNLRGMSPDVVVLDVADYRLSGLWWEDFLGGIARRAELVR